MTLQPLKTGGPYTLSVKTDKQQVTVKNILAGEVWLCSGQSNMQFALKGCDTGKEDIPQAGSPRIRQLNYQWLSDTYNHPFPTELLDSINHLRYMTHATWQECNPESAAAFSAIGYYFAQALKDSILVPVGIIQNAVGGPGYTHVWRSLHRVNITSDKRYITHWRITDA